MGSLEELRKPVRYLKGIGEVRAALFNRLGIFTVEDAISYFPREYEDRSRLKKIFELRDGESCSFMGTVASEVSETTPRKGLKLYKAFVMDQTGVITATWFNQRYIKSVLRRGVSYVFYGRINRKYRIFEVLNPVFEKLDGSELKNTCRIVPVYPSTSNLTQNMIRNAISNALKLVEGKLEDALPQWVRNRYNLSEINYSIRNIHFPLSEEDFKNARYRLAFEELLLLQLGLLRIKSALEESKEGIVFGKVPEMEEFIKSLPFNLTDAQKKVFKEIEQDMESPRVMNRLVQGDVGSGKTVVAVLAMFKAVKCGYQAAIMAPTEILARQHYKTVSQLLSNYGVNCRLLVGGMTPKAKKEALEDIEKGKVDVVVGTHALIEENVRFENLGLVVTDEQHRFGVRQRAVLSQKGENVDMLVMTATPIPRTLALILYGDLDISIIDQLPPGRKPVKTYAVDESMRERINAFIRKKVREGRQVYIVCPLVEESESIEAVSVQELAERVARRDFRDLKVGLVHGKLKPKEKDKIMTEFAGGKIDILVSTTVIEVGVDVPNATVMVVENAERFGLAQLHQLRGRVGRGKEQSYCILYSSSDRQEVSERLKVMEKTNDGFEISEKDLELRGPGEFFGTRQHGIPDLKIANLYRDIEILKKAQEAAMEILERDALLAAEENLLLKKQLLKRFESRLKELSFN